MKATRKIILIALLLFVLALALPGTALAAGGAEKGLPDEFVFGDNYTLRDGETLEGNLWVFGGNATIEAGSTVTGSIMVFGGNLILDGTVDGDVNVTGGSVLLGETAVVGGSVNLTGGSVDQSSGSQVEGGINENFRGPFQFGSRRIRLPWFDMPMPWVDMHFPFWNVGSYFMRAFLVSALAVLVAMFLPRQTAQVGRAAVAQPLISGGMGLITALVAPVVLLGLAITLILIPVSALALLLLGLVVVFGWIALGLEVGQRMAQSLFKTEWTLPVAAGLGTLIMTLVVDGIGQIPCVGWTIPAVVGMVGLGSVLLTRFGTQPYTGATAAAVVPPPPPVPPAPPVQGIEPAAGRPAEPSMPAQSSGTGLGEVSGEELTLDRPIEPESQAQPELPPDEEKKE